MGTAKRCTSRLTPEVAPEAVAEGDTEEDMMGVDYSKLVPLLVKTIQELEARIAALEAS